MSHIVTIPTKLHDATAVAAACRRLGIAEPVEGKAQLYGSEVSGLLVQLPGWKYPIVIDLGSGTTQFDNYSGAWGEQEQFNRFVQTYAVEKTKLEATRRGYTVSESALQDGSVKLQIVERS